MGLKNSQRRKRAGKKTYGSSRKKKRGGFLYGPSHEPIPVTKEFELEVLRGTAVGQLCSLIFSALRAENDRIRADEGDPARLRVMLFHAQLMEAMVHVRNAYVQEQAGNPQEPQVTRFFENRADDDDSLGGGIVLPH